MSKRTATMEWVVAKDERDWGQLCHPLTPTRPSQLHWSNGLREVFLLSLLFSSLGGWWWYTAQTAWQQAHSELMTAVQQEAATVPAARVRDLQGDLAVVTVNPAAAATAGQTRLYQRATGSWQRIVPTNEQWGPIRQRETGSFHWRYHQQDQPVVAVVAPKLEAIYATMRANFGVQDGFSPEQWLIEVSLTQPPGAAVTDMDKLGLLLVPSPSLYLTPTEISDVELLAQSLTLSLLDSIIKEASERYRLDSTWQPLLQGLRLWQLWELDLPLATWRDPVVQWLYLDLPGTGSDEVVLPQQYEQLCAAHALWLPSPTEIDIPLLCTALDKEAWYSATWGARSPLTHLQQLVTPASQVTSTTELSETDHQAPRGQTIALATLVEYAVTTYGRDRLPALVAGLGQHDSWETLLPAVYGVSVTEFDAGWQAYLE